MRGGEIAIQYLAPWCDIAPNGREFAAAFERELLREVAPGHPLHGMPVEAIGRHDACDDVLFRLADGSGRVAVVHLTWTQSPPEPLPWPVTQIYPSLEAWAEQHMRPEHDEWRARGE